MPYIYAFIGSLVLYVIYYIGKQIFASLRHIEEDMLIEFWNGRLRTKNEAEYRRVVTHLASCNSCRARLDDITQNNKARHNVDAGMINRKF